MSLFTFFSGSGSNAFKNQVKAINDNEALSDTEKMAAIDLLIYPYNPLINYDWSTTNTSGLRYLKDVGNTPTYNASMYFGRGAYLNGVDQSISSKTFSELGIANSNTFSVCITPSNVTVGTIWNTGYTSSTAGASLLLIYGKLVLSSNTNENTNLEVEYTSGNVIVTYNNKTWSIYVNGILKASRLFTYTKQQIILDTSSVFSIGSYRLSSNYCNGVLKDAYIFNRVLTQLEITQAHEQPEAFYAMAQADNTCVLNMPMCETSSTVRDYKTGINYPITNYTSSVRDNAKNLQYGLQTCKFIRDSLGVIQSASNYLECNGTGYATIPSHTNKVNIKMIVNPTSLSGNLLSGGVTKTLTGLTLNSDNDVVINDVTPTGAITLASGFTGTIKSYIEETR